MNIRRLCALATAQNKSLIQSFQSVALGVSGGIDSTALLHVFLQIAKKNNFLNFVVLHVNYGLRGPSSDRDERFVKALCDKHKVPFMSLNAAEKGLFPRLKGESTQVWARRIRHDWFRSLSDQGFQIVLGHNQNDLAENVLFRLARGSEPHTLAGMSRVDGPIWRPFIDISRADIKAAMQKDGHKWREDSSNKKDLYARNKIRLKVLPILEQISAGATGKIAELGQSLQSAAQSSLNEPDCSLSKALAGSEVSKSKIEAIRDFLAHAQLDQSLDLGQGFKLIKTGSNKGSKQTPLSSRGAQYACSLDGRECGLTIQGQSIAFVPLSAKHARNEDSKDSVWAEVGLESRLCEEFLIRAPRPDDTVNIAGSAAAFKFKELMQKWSISIYDRSKFVVVESSNGSKTLHPLTPTSCDE